jgi:hypothetical protein
VTVPQSLADVVPSSAAGDPDDAAVDEALDALDR